MSGGVDSSVAALLLQQAGHDVVGVTMKLWGGDSDTGCCSVSDVDDARRVAQQLGIDHLVFNFGDDFDEHVVAPYVDAHTRGVTPNPCIECNRSVKFARLAERADLLGFDAVATGHHANIGRTDRRPLHPRTGRRSGARTRATWCTCSTRPSSRARCSRSAVCRRPRCARSRRRSTCARPTKPDSQDVCFITSTGGRTAFLGDRIPFRSGTVVDTDGARLGEVESVELVTVGQRKGLGLPGGGPKRYVVDVDTTSATVIVGSDDDLLRDEHARRRRDVGRSSPSPASVLVQCSAHGAPRPATIELDHDGVDVGHAGGNRSAASLPARASSSTTSPTPGSSAAASAAERPEILSVLGRSATGQPRRFGSGSGKDRGASGDGEAAALRGGERRAPGAAGATRNARRWIARPFGSLGVNANTAVTDSVVVTSTAYPLAGPVRSAACVSAGASPIGATCAGSQRQRVGEHDRIVQHDAGRDEHEPATREAVPSRPENDDAGNGDRGQQRPRRSTDGRRAASGPATSAGAHSNHATTAAAPAATGLAAGIVPRRRTPTPGRTAVRSRPPSRRATVIAAGIPSSAASIASAPAMAAPIVATNASGAPTRTIVSDRTEAIASPSATTAHTVQPPIAVVQTTAVLRPSTAASTADPPTTATTIHPARAIHGVSRAPVATIEAGLVGAGRWSGVAAIQHRLPRNRWRTRPATQFTSKRFGLICRGMRRCMMPVAHTRSWHSGTDGTGR